MTSFAATWDYRCPFARNMHEHLLVGLADGADWQVRFVPFSLGQVHVPEGEPDIWDRPGDDSGLLALQAGVAVRDHDPDHFAAVHNALFAARHDDGRDLRDEATVRAVLKEQEVDADAILARVHDGSALATIKREHQEVAASHHVWGVPTLILGQEAAFIRVMNRPEGNAAEARRTVERALELLANAPEFNEFKHTSIPK